MGRRYVQVPQRGELHSDKVAMLKPAASPVPSPADCPAVRAVIGHDPRLRDVVSKAIRLAPLPLGVLVTGESGSGKELIARILHECGRRPDGPFVTVNCGALPHELAESELFGHERGAFTGAAGRRAGWFEEASGGTLVLDEVGELPLALQPKLLRVLETGKLRRVGGQGETAVSVRVVALTLRDLQHEVARGQFRIDLFHRLSGAVLALPPLRERRPDIPLLVRRALDELEDEIGPRSLTPTAEARLHAHDWPGNVRELRNVIRRAALLAGQVIDLPDLDLDVAQAIPAPRAAERTETELPRTASRCDEAAADDVLRMRGRTFLEMQKEIFTFYLQTHGGSRRRAAAALAISRSTFCDRLKRLGL